MTISLKLDHQMQANKLHQLLFTNVHDIDTLLRIFGNISFECSRCLYYNLPGIKTDIEILTYRKDSITSINSTVLIT